MTGHFFENLNLTTRIGSHLRWSGGTPFGRWVGGMKHITFWNRALTAAEAKEQYLLGVNQDIDIRQSIELFQNNVISLEDSV